MPIHGNGGHAAVVREFYSDPGWIVAIGDNRTRQKEVGRILRMGMPFGKAIHPSAIISPSAVIGDGCVVMAGAVIQTGARVGNHCILNTNCVLDHHAVLGDFAHLAPGSVVCGGSRIGEGAMVGVNGSVVQNVHVPAWYRVKANTVFHYSKLKTEESFWARVHKTEGCWFWESTKNHNGYGIVSRRAGNTLAHRVAWTLTHGEIQDGLYVCHKCDTPPCVNPDHLFLGTQKDNVQDMIKKGRYRGGFFSSHRPKKDAA